MTAKPNFGNVFSVLVVSAFIPFLPMLSIHLLVQNLMYDISLRLYYKTEKIKNFLKKLCKWDSEHIGCFILWLGSTSSIFLIMVYVMMWYVFTANSVKHQAIFKLGYFV
ncbi:hypothetical protein A9255_01990 [Xenorhabdus hominickii]|uniref:Uncharacterized protein n=1 Tax=Xenorhabdus hominickii TaxID=351679 RepID=A0ABN4S3R3_XENHO|nr:hypothetical protein A9255_01990 [Xenorhabdus hominickii]